MGGDSMVEPCKVCGYDVGFGTSSESSILTTDAVALLPKIRRISFTKSWLKYVDQANLENGAIDDSRTRAVDTN
jgi:hypothetical protein